MSVSLQSQQILRWHSGAPEYEKETLNKITVTALSAVT